MAEVIQLVIHDPRWKDIYRTESERLRQALGPKVSTVHHVGSTAVPSIRAKPIVDIATESREYPPSDETISVLASLGYEHRGSAGVPGRHWFTRGSPRLINLHWCPRKGNVVRDQLKFRDRLIVDIFLAKEYEQLKLDAAIDKDVDDSSYAEAKSEFINLVLDA